MTQSVRTKKEKESIMVMTATANGKQDTFVGVNSSLFSHDCNKILKRKRFVDANESAKRFLCRF
jgi:hypothetical protein